MGTRSESTARPLAGNAQAENRLISRGGQASIGLFGIAGATGSKAPEGKAPTRQPHRSRIKGALNSFDTDGLSPAHYGLPGGAVLSSFPRGLSDAPAAPSPIRVTLERERMAVFATVATHETRPLPDVITEALTARIERAATTQGVTVEEYIATAVGCDVDSLEEAMIVHPQTGEVLCDYSGGLYRRLEAKETDPPIGKENDPNFAAPAYENRGKVNPVLVKHDAGDRREKLAEFDRLVGKGIPECKAARSMGLTRAHLKSMRLSVERMDEGRPAGRGCGTHIDLGLAILSCPRLPVAPASVASLTFFRSLVV